jgi:HrpA-like RNA helicase
VLGGGGGGGGGGGAAGGAVLVFFHGWDEIQRTAEAIRSHPFLGEGGRVLPLPLHSQVPSAEQRRVFKRPPAGVTKVVLATNIAETSLTIEDVVYVIDTGTVREKNYDAYTGCASLAPTWVSRASARQRVAGGAAKRASDM